MPVIFLFIIVLILISFALSKINYSNKKGTPLKFIVCFIVWFSMIYRFVNIAFYIDESGEKIQNIVGNFGNILSWISLIIFSIYLGIMFFEMVKDFKNQKA